ncbi:hypothetical protein ABZY93_26010 [Streptomyces smyrnaeus]|uniref:DUF3885 domain-containing protein n=1 Tax=Streptomyces smyrnaeus TaxID=1387713 RepID=UPI0027DAB718|nr:hypothetical protein [Streptomyces smyrnaeus]
MSGSEQAALTALWQQRWPECDPVGHRLRGAYPEVWVRFHSLPKSKRYPENDGEYAVVLERYNTVLDELFADEDVYVVRPVWTAEPGVPAHAPGAGYWRTLPTVEDPDPEYATYSHLFVGRRPWRLGCIDGLLRAVADDEVAGVLVTDVRMERIHHPYDGGADVFVRTPAERDRLRNRHAGWLSSHPAGL